MRVSIHLPEAHALFVDFEVAVTQRLRAHPCRMDAVVKIVLVVVFMTRKPSDFQKTDLCI